MSDQLGVNSHDVPNCQKRKAETVTFAGGRIDRSRSCCSLTASEHIGTDDEIFVRIEPFARADEAVPPPWFTVIGGVQTSGMRITRQCVTNKNGVGGIGIERTIGLVGNSDRAEFLTTGKPQRNRRVKQLDGLSAHNSHGIGTRSDDIFWIFDRHSITLTGNSGFVRDTGSGSYPKSMTMSVQMRTAGFAGCAAILQFAFRAALTILSFGFPDSE